MFIPGIERDGALYKHEDAVIEKECLQEILDELDKRIQYFKKLEKKYNEKIPTCTELQNWNNRLKGLL